jgi:hypothetical protein
MRPSQNSDAIIRYSRRRDGVKRLGIGVVIVLILSIAALSWTAVIGAEEVERITKESLMEMLDDPTLVIVDVRIKSHWESSNRKIKGAVREDPKDVEAWMNGYNPEKTLVFYCK